jgi:hypothetical protein
MKTYFNTKITISSLEICIDVLGLKAYIARTLTKKITFLTNCKKNIDMQLHHHQFCQYYLQIISSSLVHKPQLMLQFSGGNSLEQKNKT